MQQKSAVAKLIGSRIRLEREKRGWSQDQLASRLGVSNVSVSRYESGERDIRTGTINRIAYALGVEPAELVAPFTGTEPEKFGVELTPEGAERVADALVHLDEFSKRLQLHERVLFYNLAALLDHLIIPHYSAHGPRADGHA